LREHREGGSPTRPHKAAVEVVNSLAAFSRAARGLTEERAVLTLPPFQLDSADERLWRDGEEARLRREPFA